MGRTGNMILQDFIRQMCILLENRVYFGDGDSVNMNPVSLVGDICYAQLNCINIGIDVPSNL